MSHLIYGVQLGALDTIIYICVAIVTADIQDKDGRFLLRLVVSILFVGLQVGIGGYSVEQGGDFWGPMLDVGYVVLGVMLGALGVYRVYEEVSRRMERDGEEKKR